MTVMRTTSCSTMARSGLCLFIVALGLVGCDEKKSQLEKKPALELDTGPSAAELEARREAEEQARLEREKERERKEREQALAALDSCCLALAKRGFELRNSDYIDGKKACEAAREKAMLLPFALPAIAQALDEEKLPPACQVTAQDREAAERLAPSQADRSGTDEADRSGTDEADRSATDEADRSATDEADDR